jgi:hypothetical protein
MSEENQIFYAALFLIVAYFSLIPLFLNREKCTVFYQQACRLSRCYLSNLLKVGMLILRTIYWGFRGSPT